MLDEGVPDAHDFRVESDREVKGMIKFRPLVKPGLDYLTVDIEYRMLIGR
jgi:hypothetical protein